MADMDFYQLLAEIRTKFPQFLPYLYQPGVFAVLGDAILNGRSDIDVTAALQHTPYFLNTPIQTRQFQALQYLDPATASSRAADTKRIFDDLERELGITLDTSSGLSSSGFQLFARAVNEGWDANRIRYELIAASGGKLSGGAMASTAAHIKQMANDYGVPLSDMQVTDFATKMAQGAMDEAGVQGYLLIQAKSMYPGLAAQLDRGFTVRQIADPYLQLASQELGINPTTVNLTDQKWLKIFNQIDPKTGQRTSMDLDQALAVFRTDPAFGYDTTSQGRQSATTLATSLMTKFGNAA